MRSRIQVVVVLPLVVAVGMLLGVGPAGADVNDPTAGTRPTSAGMPGGALVEKIMGWGQWLGIAACAAAIIYGASTWHGFSGASAGRAQTGKMFVMAGAVGLLLIGLLHTMVSTLVSTGQAG